MENKITSNPNITAEEMRHQLEISEIKFRKLFEMAQDGIFLIDPLTEKIIDANPFLLKLIGYSLEEVVGKKLYELGAFRDIAESKTVFQELQDKGYVRYEDMPLKAKDGHVVEVEFVSNLYPIDGTKMIQCNIRDIADRKRAERIAAIYLEEVEKTNKLLTDRQKSMIDIGNTLNLSERERVEKIMSTYSAGLSAIQDLIKEWKSKVGEQAKS